MASSLIFLDACAASNSSCEGPDQEACQEAPPWNPLPPCDWGTAAVIVGGPEAIIADGAAGVSAVGAVGVSVGGAVGNCC